MEKIREVNTPQTVVIIGNGMVGHRFCEKLVEFDVERRYRIVTFCEEPRPAYDRVGLTQYFTHRDAEQLMLTSTDWYAEHEIELHVGDKAMAIDRERKIVQSEKGVEIPYDIIVLATGSYPFVPPIPGVDKAGVFVYRTIEDLQAIIEYGQGVEKAAVIGGGLLGLEAAKAAYDLGLETHVIEFMPRLMPRQVDDAGSNLLIKEIENLGVTVHVDTGTKEILGNGKVEGMIFNSGEELDVEMVIVSAGIRPRDELARACELEMGERGGVVINDHLQTSDPDIYAIGEVALHGGMIYGLVAPGYEMAETLAARLTSDETKAFIGTDLSTKLKLMGVDVASFGDYTGETTKPLTYEDTFDGVYKKLFFSADGKKLVGGILVGDASDYGSLMMLTKNETELTAPPSALVLGSSSNGGVVISATDMPDETQVCQCNIVSKGEICAAIREQDFTEVGQVKSFTKAGTGCGGCVPLVTDLLKQELEAAGKTINTDLCEHFPYTRQELFDIVRIKEIRTFDRLITEYGRGYGCETCKPAVTSMLASLWNENIMFSAHQTLQDTNDRFLANMQRGGLYSVIPRVPGGEITPERLIALGSIAKKYGLYTKITGGQRIDMFGAQLHQLPDIWEELVNAGFESGHAYGKALRTVKSCVGKTWCRYAVQDSVKFAIEVEQRYRGIRSPHKMKSAVSGCVRECAEAQGKDFGLIATEKGYNLYVCGNGGANPRHADLLASDIDEKTAIKYLDRFMMFYIMTADKLTRTSVWLEKMEGGIDYLKSVIIDDKLGICDELEQRMEHLVDTYRCEWREAVKNPEIRKKFRQFVNTDETEVGIEFVEERGQARPKYWEKDLIPLEDITLPTHKRLEVLRNSTEKEWIKVGKVKDFPQNGGAAIKYGKTQIAVFNFTSRGEWYAAQNMCPHKKAFVLSRGIVGDAEGVPKIACPLHKKNFSLESGACISGEDYEILTFPVKVEGGDVYLELPPQEHLDAALATENFCNTGAFPKGPAQGAAIEPATPYLRVERPDGQVDYTRELRGELSFL
jgi:nitrite reductase (NADH) large subunit